MNNVSTAQGNLLERVRLAPEPQARTSDPATSHLAASKHSRSRLTHDRVLQALRLGPATDEQIYVRVELDWSSARASVTPQRIRTARKDLEKEGAVVCVGMGQSKRGNACQVWGLAD